MNRTAGPVLLAFALLVLHPRHLAAQDTAVVVPAPQTLSLDTTRLQAFHRSYEMVVQAGDTSHVIGRRMVSFTPADYAGAQAWLVLETRSGLVPAVESLYVTPELHPIHWSSTLGRARLAMQFTRDSIFGATSGPGGKQNVILAAPPDLIISLAMLEALLPFMQLTPAFTDSMPVLSVDQAASTILPAELTVVGRETFPAPFPAIADSLYPGDSIRPSDFSIFRDPSALARTAWIVVLRSDARSVILWVDVEDGTLLRLQRPLPLHTGNLLEYRAHPETFSPPPDVPAGIPPPRT